MRMLFGLLLALVLLVPQPADAARRDERTTQATRTTAPATTSRPAVQRTVRPAASRPTAQRATTQRSTRPTATRSTATRSTARTPTRSAARSNTRPGDVRSQRQGVVVRGASAAAISRVSTPTSARSCTRRNGRTICTTQRRVAQNPVAGWHRGLSNASMSQRDCPAGTFATLARGHDDIVRCMPL